jgi:S1-C subfamily serine protease
MAVGLLVGAHLARPVAERLNNDHPSGALVAATLILLTAALVGQILGRLAGSRLRLTVPAGRARRADCRLGAVAGVGGVALAGWLLLPIISVLRSWPAQEAQDSAFASVVTDRLPDPPNTLRSLASLVGPVRWQELLTGLPSQALPPPPPSPGVRQEIIDQTRGSVVKVDGRACGDDRRGSGFVVQGNLVVTNAHVVAGVDNPKVSSESQPGLDANLLVYDSGRDLAVLEVPGLDAPSLVLRAAAKGDRGAVFGYPGGDRLVWSPFEVAFVKQVRMPDLYKDDGQTQPRNVIFLSAGLKAGDSGSPLIDSEGSAVGVAFAISPKIPNLALALTIADVKGIVASAARLHPQAGFEPPPHRCLEPDSTGTTAAAEDVVR